jgi:hypothetical protein
MLLESYSPVAFELTSARDCWCGKSLVTILQLQIVSDGGKAAEGEEQS